MAIAPILRVVAKRLIPLLLELGFEELKALTMKEDESGANVVLNGSYQGNEVNMIVSLTVGEDGMVTFGFGPYKTTGSISRWIQMLGDQFADMPAGKPGSVVKTLSNISLLTKLQKVISKFPKSLQKSATSNESRHRSGMKSRRFAASNIRWETIPSSKVLTYDDGIDLWGIRPKMGGWFVSVLLEEGISLKSTKMHDLIQDAQMEAEHRIRAPFDNLVGMSKFAADRKLVSMIDKGEGRGADLQDADLKGASLQGADLSSADLQGANLQKADLRSSNLAGADLGKAKLQSASLEGSNLVNAIIEGADLERATLKDANLTDANLQKANLKDTNLAGSNLRGADLYGANLTSANLSNATLSETLFEGANLSGANFSGANLTRAYLGKADLKGADLLNAKNLEDADLEGVKYDAKTKWPKGFTPPVEGRMASRVSRNYRFR